MNTQWPISQNENIAIVTGASAGIGKAIAIDLVRSGKRVVAGARRTSKLEEIRQDIAPELRNNYLVHSLDVRDPQSIEAFLEFARSHGAIDTVINNAGLAAGVGHVREGLRDDWLTMLETNINGAFDVTRATIQDIIDNRGDMMFIASVAGVDPYAGGAVYCATKSALQSFAKSLRHEVLGSGVRVLTINPGMVETEFSVRRLGDVAKAEQVYAGMTPLTAQDISDCAMFALSRPRHMCVDEILALATDQSSAKNVFRRS